MSELEIWEEWGLINFLMTSFSKEYVISLAKKLSPNFNGTTFALAIGSITEVARENCGSSVVMDLVKNYYITNDMIYDYLQNKNYDGIFKTAREENIELMKDCWKKEYTNVEMQQNIEDQQSLNDCEPDPCRRGSRN